MIAFANRARPARPDHTRFLAMLPAIVGYARRCLRYLDAEAREDAVAEVVANCFVAYARLVEVGKEDLAYPSVLAIFAVRQFHDGRRVGNPVNRHDAYAQPNNNRHREYLGTPQDQPWRESLIDNTKSPVPDQAAFRIDFPAWLRNLRARDRRVALQLARGERTIGVARRLRVSKGRVSQIRRELCDGWLRFYGELPVPVEG